MTHPPPLRRRNWGAKSGFFWVGTGLLCILWSWFRMPETGGFSFAELDILFANKVSARKFKSVVITGQRRVVASWAVLIAR